MKLNVGLICPTENKILILSLYEGGEEGELLAELHVEGGDACADGGQHGGHVVVDVLGLKVDGCVHRLHDLLHVAND